MFRKKVWLLNRDIYIWERGNITLISMVSEEIMNRDSRERTKGKDVKLCEGPTRQNGRLRCGKKISYIYEGERVYYAECILWWNEWNKTVRMWNYAIVQNDKRNWKIRMVKKQKRTRHHCSKDDFRDTGGYCATNSLLVTPSISNK